MNFEEWVADLRSKDWYKQPEPEADGEDHNTYFNLETDSTEHEPGSFLVAYDHETYCVYPGLSYQINDTFMNVLVDGNGNEVLDENGYLVKGPWWWEETTTQVPRVAMGKWLGLHGFSDPILTDAKSSEPQEVWVVINGGWMWTPRESRTTFRSHLAGSIQVEDEALWWLASILTTRNLGLAIVPRGGKLLTYELDSLDVAVAQPAEIVERFRPCENLRRIGIGRFSFSFSVSGTGASEQEMDEGSFEQVANSVNKPIGSAKDLLEILGSWDDLFDQKRVTAKFFKWKRTKRPNVQIHEYLVGRAGEHFAKLAEAGYALALIPLGGKTIWVPEGK